MKCFYHNDMDGKCAGAIVYLAKGHGDYYSINYNQEFPFEIINFGEEVIIVDFSLQKDGDFQKLLSITKNVVWIDHHKTSIEKHKDLFVHGIRQEGIAGCVLTWKYYLDNFALPKLVDMIGSYDVWDFSRFGDKLNVLQSGLRLYDTDPKNDNWRLWLFDSSGKNTEDYLDEILSGGEIALKYRTNMWNSLCKSWAFFIEFEGYKTICCNAGSVSSQLFDNVEEDYDLMMSFVFDGKKWTVSIYTKKDIDCSEIAKKYGGGGHKQASGMQLSMDQFIKLFCII